MIRATPTMVISCVVVAAAVNMAPFAASAQQETQPSSKNVESSNKVGYSAVERPGIVTNVRAIRVTDDRRIISETEKYPPEAHSVTVQFDDGTEKSFVQRSGIEFDLGTPVRVIFKMDGVQIKPAVDE